MLETLIVLTKPVHTPLHIRIIDLYIHCSLFSALKQKLTLIILDDIPNDGIPIDDVVTVSLALTVLYVIFAVAGIVFAVICPVFTLIFRNKK